MPDAVYSRKFLRGLPIEDLEVLLMACARKADEQTAAKQPIDPAIETILSDGRSIYNQRVQSSRAVHAVVYA